MEFYSRIFWKIVMDATTQEPQIVIFKSKLHRPSVCSSNQSFPNSSEGRLSVPDDIPGPACRFFAFCIYVCSCFGWPCHMCEQKLRGKTEDGNTGEGQVCHFVSLFVDLYKDKYEWFNGILWNCVPDWISVIMLSSLDSNRKFFSSYLMYSTPFETPLEKQQHPLFSRPASLLQTVRQPVKICYPRADERLWCNSVVVDPSVM